MDVVSSPAPVRPSSRRWSTRSTSAYAATTIARHPVFLLSVVAALALSLWPWRAGEEPRQRWPIENLEVIQLGAAPMLCGTFLAAYLVVVRDRRSPSLEALLATMPRDRSARAKAAAVGCILLAAAASLAWVVVAVVVRALGGVTVGVWPDTVTAQVSVVDMLSVGAATFSAGCAGVLVAQLTTIDLLAVAITAGFVILLLVPYWFWTNPPQNLVWVFSTPYEDEVIGFQQPGPATAQSWDAMFRVWDDGEGLPSYVGLTFRPDVGLAHAVYVVGVGLLFRAAALVAAGGASRRTWAVAVATVVLGVAAQVALLALR